MKRRKLRVAVAADRHVEVDPKSALLAILAVVLGLAALIFGVAAWLKWGNAGLVVSVLALGFLAAVTLAFAAKLRSWRLNAEERRVEVAEKAARAAYLQAQARGIVSQAAVARLQAQRVILNAGQVFKDFATKEVLFAPHAPRPAATAPSGDPSKPSVDLIVEMAKPGWVWAIIGGQRSGKSHLARHVAAEFLRRGHDAWIVTPALGTVGDA